MPVERHDPAYALTEDPEVIRAHAELDRMGVPKGATLDGRLRELHARLRDVLEQVEHSYAILNRVAEARNEPR